MVFLAGIITFAIILISHASPEAKARKELKIANQYLDEMQYEMAIASYMKVIEIDPKNVDAYEGLVSVYAEMAEVAVLAGDIDLAMDYYAKAITVLEQGIQETGDKNLENLRNEIKEKKKRLEESEKELNLENEGADSANDEETVVEVDDEETEEAPAWIQIYYDYVVGIPSEYNYAYSEYSDYFALVDLDKDGVPEIAHAYKPNDYEGCTDISTVKNDQIQAIVQEVSGGRSGQLIEAIDLITFYDGGSIEFISHGLSDYCEAYSLMNGQWVHTATLFVCYGGAVPMHNYYSYDNYITGEHLEERCHVYVNGVEVTEEEFDYDMNYEERWDDYGVGGKYETHFQGNRVDVEWMDRNAMLSYLLGQLEEYRQQENTVGSGEYTDTSWITEAQIWAALNDKLGNMIRYYATYNTPAGVVNRINGNNNCREAFPMAGVNMGEAMFCYFPFELVEEEWSEYISESDLKAYRYFETGSENIDEAPSFMKNGENYYYMGENGTGGFCDYTNELGDFEIVDIDGERYTVRFRYVLKVYDWGRNDVVTIANEMIYITIKLDPQSAVNGARFESARME
ncbi:MAG: hypothetical protein MJ105_00065 [Lachnospiraceae bacterium]|nr:hypothetical protein [Lachnospiraceae bacterium]